MEHSIGEMISRCRQNQNMTQEEFASRLGVTPQAVSKWERGTSLPDIALLPGICQILKISSDRLLGISTSRISENKDVSVEREIKRSMFAEPLKLEFGYGLVSCMTKGLKTEYVNQRRKELAAGKGMLLPIIRVADSGDLKDREIQIISYGKVLSKKEYPEEEPYCSIIDEVVRQCEGNYASILNKQLVRCMMEALEEQYPGVVEGLVPDKVSYYEVLEYLRAVLEREGNLRDMIHIMEQLEKEL